MKRMIDSFIRNIVRQSLNENYGLLNEDTASKANCPDGGFCLGGGGSLDSGSILNAINLKNSLKAPRDWKIGQDIITKFINFCSNNEMGKGNEDVASKAVDDINTEAWSDFDVDEIKVKRFINGIGDFPTWCLTNKMAYDKGYNDWTGSDADQFPMFSFWGTNGVTGKVDQEDYPTIVVAPVIELFKKSIKITVTEKAKYDEKRATDVAKWTEGLEKSGWGERDETGKLINKDKAYAEWKKAGWKSKPKEYTIGGGGKNSVGVSFDGYQCIPDHPALDPTQIPIPRGVGFKLKTGNPTIDRCIYGVAKSDDTDNATDVGVMYREDTDISLVIDCTYKFLQHSLSTTPWNYNAVIDNGGKIALTTDPKYNNNIKLESIKGFRHNLLTEADLKFGSEGAEVESIQKKLGVLPVTKVFDEKTKAAVIDFQTMMKILPANGIVDDKTLKKINDTYITVTPPSATEWTRDLKIGSTGVDVEAIQKQLGAKGGKFGTDTETKVKEFQKKYGLLVTGIVDKTTFDKIISMDAVGTADTYSGQKHNYIAGNWIKITPNDNDSQFSANNGYFKIYSIVDQYTVVIDATIGVSGTIGGSTQRVLFGEEAKDGTKEVIKGDRNNSGTRTKGSTRSRTSSTGNVETKKRRDVRNSEYCDSLRKIKKHLKLKVDCKKYQSTLNQIMLALTGGVQIKPVTPVTPVTPVAPVAPITPSGNVTIY